MMSDRRLRLLIRKFGGIRTNAWKELTLGYGWDESDNAAVDEDLIAFEQQQAFVRLGEPPPIRPWRRGHEGGGGGGDGGGGGGGGGGEEGGGGDNGDVTDAARQFGVGAVGRIECRSLNEEGISRAIFSRDHRPFFTYWVCLAQLVVALAVSIAHPFAPPGVGLARSQEFVLTEWLTMEQVAVLQPSNVWLGPRVADLVRLGAKFAPCMRRDDAVTDSRREEEERERSRSGCCVRNDRSGCVQTTQDGCSRTLSTFVKWTNMDNSTTRHRISGPVCGLDPHYCDSPTGALWPDDVTKWPSCQRMRRPLRRGAPAHVTCKVVARPCCIGIYGRCQLKTQEFCDWVGGIFHPTASLCSQVDCMQSVCGDAPFSPRQSYRVFTALFLHAGWVHLVVVLAFQLWLMRDTEKMCGCARMAVIYLGSGAAGHLCSAVFVPYQPECGPSGAIFGVLATLLAEIFRAWSLLRRPWRAVAIHALAMVALFIAGLVPWVDNYAHLSGFIAGFALSMVLLPTVDEGDVWSTSAVFWSVVFAVSFVGLACAFFAFPYSFCDGCAIFSCLPITRDFCAEQRFELGKEHRYF